MEVACGGGRILAPLANAGHAVTGFDMDKYILERCQLKIKGMENAPSYQANALTDDWGIGYDIVVMAGNILVNIVTDGDYVQAQELFIRKAVAALKQGGHLYLDFDCYTRPTSSDNSEWTVFDGTDDRGTYGKFIFIGSEYDPITRMYKNSFRRLELTLVNGEPFTYTYEWSKHFPSYVEMQNWLIDAGFITEWAYDGYDRRPIDGLPGLKHQITLNEMLINRSISPVGFLVYLYL